MTAAYLCRWPVPWSTTAEFYAVACDPRRSVVVEACAGAGKTWMLVSRILRALLDGAEPVADPGHHVHAQGRGRDAASAWTSGCTTSRPTGCDTGHSAIDGPGASAACRRPQAQSGWPTGAGRACKPSACWRQGTCRCRCSTFHGWFAQLLSGQAPLQPAAPQLGLAAEVCNCSKTRSELHAGADAAISTPLVACRRRAACATTMTGWCERHRRSTPAGLAGRRLAARRRAGAGRPRTRARAH